MQQYFENKKRGSDNFPFAYYKEKYSNHTIKLHWHPEVELLYGIAGEVIVMLSEKQYILRAGDILFINPKELHSYKPQTKPVEYHAAVFDLSMFKFKEEHFIEQRFTTPIENGSYQFPRLLTPKHPKYDIIQPIVHNLFNEHIHSKSMIFADLTTLFCSLLVHNLLEPVSDADAYKKSENIKTCIKYMDANYAKKITLNELAELVHMSPNYFCSYFKKQTGISLFTQLNYIRIKKASKLLRNSEASISDIAESCGFDNVSFFIRKFKETKGCTPSVYRRQKNRPV